MPFKVMSLAISPQAAIALDGGTKPFTGSALTITILALFATPKVGPATFEATQLP
jgi:hypothetical protein